MKHGFVVDETFCSNRKVIFYELYVPNHHSVDLERGNFLTTGGIP